MDYEFKKGKFIEEQLEHAIIQLFKDQDYTYVDGESIHRRYEDVLLIDDLEWYLHNRYANQDLSDTEVAKIVNELQYISSTPLYAGNRQA